MPELANQPSLKKKQGEDKNVRRKEAERKEEEHTFLKAFVKYSDWRRELR